jgi:catechol 2,3-dioxygenase-like lactoylglutathione lyase family enzyme
MDCPEGEQRDFKARATHLAFSHRVPYFSRRHAVHRPSFSGNVMSGEIGFDRKAEDIGNIIKLEHVNLTVPDQRLATIFYVSGLGLTRDPYLMTGVDNMWINAGDSQFHLPTSPPQIFRGCVGLVIPDRGALMSRLSSVRDLLAGSRFDFAEHEDHVEAVCPWGNRIRCHGPDPARFGAIILGMPYVEFQVPRESAAAIAEFYGEVFMAPGQVTHAGGELMAVIAVGAKQELRFRETGAAPAAYDGHHIQIYVADFSSPYGRLKERGLITEESDQHQYRFVHIVNLRDNAIRFTIEHEIRSIRHPLYARPLVNRNPSQSNRCYFPGHDALL